MRMDDQEYYLKHTHASHVFMRGFKKLITECTSVKFLLLCFVCLGIAKHWIGDAVGLGTALLILGVREVPVDAIMTKITGGLTATTTTNQPGWADETVK